MDSRSNAPPPVTLCKNGRKLSATFFTQPCLLCLSFFTASTALRPPGSRSLTSSCKFPHGSVPRRTSMALASTVDRFTRIPRPLGNSSPCGTWTLRPGLLSPGTCTEPTPSIWSWKRAQEKATGFFSEIATPWVRIFFLART